MEFLSGFIEWYSLAQGDFFLSSEKSGELLRRLDAGDIVHFSRGGTGVHESAMHY